MPALDEPTFLHNRESRPHALSSLKRNPLKSSINQDPQKPDQSTEPFAFLCVQYLNHRIPAGSSCPCGCHPGRARRPAAEMPHFFGPLMDTCDKSPPVPTFCMMTSLMILFGSIGIAEPAFAARACAQKTVTGQSVSGSVLSAVEIQAKKSWRRKVAAQNGPSWSHWNAAGARSLECRKTNGDAMQCQASGIPCKDMSSGERNPATRKYRLVR